MINIQEFSYVWMKKEQLPGFVLGIETSEDGRNYAIVESRKEYSKPGSSERWPVYYCAVEDLEPM